MSDKPARKHRVVDWNPTASAAQTGKSAQKTRAMALFAVLSLAVAATAVGVAWRVVSKKLEAQAAAEAASPTSREPAYVSRGRAELAYETASRNLAEIRKMPINHQNLLQGLALVERSFVAAELLLNQGQYAEASTAFDSVNQRLDDFTETVTLQRDAGKRYDELFRRLRVAERTRDFMPEAYDAAFTATGEGRVYLEQGAFRAAWSAFDEASKLLDNFEDRQEAYIQDRLQDGQLALNEGQRDAAETAFKAALQYDSGNEAALRGLKRAETIAAVHSLLQHAKAAEDAADYDTAIDAYHEAFELDNLSVVAQQGEGRARKLRDESHFEAHVAAAKAAAEAGEWSTVIARYQDALDIYPDRETIKSALSSARASHHDAMVLATLGRAYDLEREHKWDQARATYEELLEIEPQHPESIEGLIRVGRTVRALLEYEKLIELCAQQVEAADFQSAIRTFNAAAETKPGYLPFSEKALALRTTLERNSQPIAITFNSDDRTWVSISNYRMLGRIKNETVSLPPGDYQVIGRRKNYQDVMILLRVRPNMSTNVVNVICTTKADS